MNNTKLLFIAFVLLYGTVYSQVGVNTTSPKTTMDVSAKRANPDGTGLIDDTQALGLQAPRVTRAELTDNGNNVTYGVNQAGALIYVTDISGGDILGQRAEVAAVGYYYFDAGANRWKPIGSGGGSGSVTAVQGLENPTASSVGIADPIRFIYSPSISINTSVIGGSTLDIHEEYMKQFSGTGANPLIKNATTENATIPTYPENYFDYYVTEYDASVIAPVSITDAGVLTYNVLAGASACSFMNVVMVLRKTPR